MVIAKQMEIRSDIKKFFDLAYNGEIIVVPRKQSKNVVIISEEEYNRLNSKARMISYASEIMDASGTDKTKSILADNLKKLEAIKTFKDDWNGNGAPAFSAEIIEKVCNLLKRLPIQPEIFPTALQTIQLEYENTRRDHMEIEIGESQTAEIYVASSNGEETEEAIPYSVKALKERVMDFYG